MLEYMLAAGAGAIASVLVAFIKSQTADRKNASDAAGELVDDLKALFLQAVERTEKAENDRLELHAEVSRLQMRVKQLQRENDVQAQRIAELERLLLNRQLGQG